MDPKKILKEILRDTEEHFVRNALYDLKSKGFAEINTAMGDHIMAARILTDGKTFLQQKHHQGASLVTQQYHDNSINVNAEGSIVNVQSILKQTNQRLENSKLNEQDKIQEAFAELLEILKTVPPEYSEEADTIRESAEELIRNATKNKPIESRVQGSAEGLKEAADALSAVVPKVLPIASLLVQLVVSGLGLG